MNDRDKSYDILLRATEPADLETLFAHQADEEAAHMAAFINENWNDKDAYLAKWNKLLSGGTVNIRTVVVDHKVAGTVFTWQLGDELQISYGLGKAYWHKGIATHALQQFLDLVPDRPLFGRVAFDNIGSAKVLTKCGFKKIREEQSFAYARKAEIVEFVFLLEK
jgi:ribosomal-protein-alanine N-acetyltransferase